MPHWKHTLKAKCRTIVNDMVKKYGFRYESGWTGKTCWTTLEPSGYVVWAAYPTGYVSLSTFLHEVGHVAARDCEPSRVHDLVQELRAWQFARSVFEEYGLPWTISASENARGRFQSSVRILDASGVSAKTAELLEAIETFDKSGI